MILHIFIYLFCMFFFVFSRKFDEETGSGKVQAPGHLEAIYNTQMRLRKDFSRIKLQDFEASSDYREFTQFSRGLAAYQSSAGGRVDNLDKLATEIAAAMQQLSGKVEEISKDKQLDDNHKGSVSAFTAQANIISLSDSKTSGQQPTHDLAHPESVTRSNSFPVTKPMNLLKSEVSKQIIPNFSKQQGPEERLHYHRNFHKCKDGGEAYSAAYLITKEHLMEQFTAYNLTWVNCEMGSFIMINAKTHPGKDRNGSVTQSLDILDFSVIHLSAYERLQRRWAKSIGTENMNVGNIEPVKVAIALLKERALTMHAQRTQQMNMFNKLHKDHPITLQLNRTIAIMPWLGGEMGAGHSNLNNRYVYLEACFWSLYAVFPHVAVVVKTEKDWKHCQQDSKLPFFAVHHLKHLPKNAALPVATVQLTKQQMQSGGPWEPMFDHMYFTESDQILMMRNIANMYEMLRKHPRRLLLPHRLMPYPDPVLNLFHKRTPNKDITQLSETEKIQIIQEVSMSTGKTPALFTDPWGWEHLSCCVERQNCMDRHTWIHVSNDSLPVLPLLGMRTPLGNSNFHAESYRSCQLMRRVDMCP